jgi:hypothetical protein
MLKQTLAVLTLVTILAFAGCSSGEKKQSEAQPSQEKKAEPTEYLGGREAFQKLYVSARSFAGDVKPYRLQSTYTKDAPAQEGKAALWRAEFASPSKRAIKAYSWSGLSGPDAPDRGVSHGTEDTYNPSNTSTQVFDIAFLKIDSSKAFDEAQKHGGEKLTKKDPKQPVFYVLDWSSKTNQLTWHVIYGSDRNDAKLTVAVDATTGAFQRIEH